MRNVGCKDNRKGVTLAVMTAAIVRRSRIYRKKPNPPAKIQHQTKLKGAIMNLIKELWAFLKERKKFWLFPVIVVMLFLGALIVLAKGSAVAPFIYTIF